MKLLIASGGTGGHISPALAIADKGKLAGLEILFLTTEQGLEQEFLQNNKYQVQTISAAPFPREISGYLFKSIFYNTKAFIESRKIHKAFKPDVVLGTGSYAAGAPVLAASLLGIPVIIHEQNSHPGLANKILSFTADKIAVSYPGSKKHFNKCLQNKIHHTGNPIRSQILNSSKNEAREKFNIPSDYFVILVMGGSQGSEKINKKMLAAYNEILTEEKLYVFHITGKPHYNDIINSAKDIVADEKRDRIKFYDFCEEIQYPLAASDLFIGRAGATTIAEITACGLPAILIPYPYAAADHQNYNARELKAAGAAKIIQDQHLTADLIAKKIKNIYTDSNLEMMSEASLRLGQPQAGEKLLKLLKNLGGEG